MGKILLVSPEKCTGCRICELWCSFRKTKTCNPVRSRIRIIEWEELGIVVPVVCQHCEDPVCATICPGHAIKKDKETGVVSTDLDRCIGCHMCIMVCPLGGPSLDVTGGKVIRCDLCQGEEEPPCAKMCPTEAIRFVSGDVAGMTLKREAMEKLFSLTKQSLETKYV